MKILAPSLYCTEKDSYLGARQAAADDEKRAAAASLVKCVRPLDRRFLDAGHADLAADGAAEEAAKFAPGHAVRAADQLVAVAVVHAGDFRRGSGNGRRGAGGSTGIGGHLSLRSRSASAIVPSRTSFAGDHFIGSLRGFRLRPRNCAGIAFGAGADRLILRYHRSSIRGLARPVVPARGRCDALGGRLPCKTTCSCEDLFEPIHQLAELVFADFERDFHFGHIP